MSKKIQFFEDKNKTKQIYPEIKEPFETGSNENGNYIKFNNGLLICYGEKVYSNMSFSDDYWSYYQRSHDQNLFISFPISFIEKPYCLVTTNGNQYWLSANTLMGDKLSTSRSHDYVAIGPKGYTTNRDVVLVYYAIGKWK